MENIKEAMQLMRDANIRDTQFLKEANKRIEELEKESNKWMDIAYRDGTNNDINCEKVIELSKQNTILTQQLKESEERVKELGKHIAFLESGTNRF